MRREFSWAAVVTVLVVVAVHLGCLGMFWTEVSWAAAITCLVLFKVRGFGITGAYHRYFSHRSYKTSRPFQFILALLGSSALQGTPLEWSRNHRHHHRYSDKENDIHSPRQHGLWWAHMGWIMTIKPRPVDQRVRDLQKFPEIRAVAYLQIVVIVALVASLYWFGEMLGPTYHTSGLQMLVWGFCVNTVLLWHFTYSINSFSHTWGTQRFESDDDSRNNFWIALVSLGEGWHNNHHRYPSSARNGFYWWEIDTTYYVLKMLAWLGLIWDLRAPPAEVYAEAERA